MNLGFLNPRALWMLTAVAIPIVIHLLHRGQSQRVLVGSIRFLKGRETQTLTRLKLTERRLLALRIVLIVLVAMLLAKPFLLWEQERNAPAGWVLVDPRLANMSTSDLEQIEPEFGEIWTQAHLEGWRISWLANHFPAWGDATPTFDPANEIWSLVAEAAMDLPDDRPLHVLTLGLMSDFHGNRPVLAHQPVGWHHVEQPVLEHSQHLLGGYCLNDQRMVLITGQMVEGQWQRERHLLSWNGQQGNFDLEGVGTIVVREDTDAWLVGLEGRSAAAISIGRKPVSSDVLILAEDPRGEDVRSLKVALETVARFYDWPLQISVGSAKDAQGTSAQLIFALGLAQTDFLDAWEEKPLLVFTDAGQEAYDQVRSAVLWDGAYPGNAPDLARRVPSVGEGQVLWKDTLGQPLLTLDTNQTWQRYNFASRFLPQWSQLAHHQAFPLWLAEMVENYWLSHQRDQAWDQDLRVYQPNLVRPTSEPMATGSQDQATASLSLPLWCLLMAVFAAERWWSLRRQAP